MGSKRIGLARLEALVEGLKRELAMGSAVLRGKGFQPVAQAVTAAVAGADISAGSSHVTVTSGNANHWVNLPAPVVGNIIHIFVGTNGCELRSSAPATIAINGGAGADYESALPANSLTVCVCTSATTWVAYEVAANGAVSAAEVAA
jgi:hypothetical protein